MEIPPAAPLPKLPDLRPPPRSPVPESFKRLGRLIHIAGSGQEGTPIYVKHPDQFQMDSKPIENFQIFGSRSVKDTGLESGRLHSIVFKGKGKDPYYQTVITQTPDDGGAFVWKTVGAVTFVGAKGEKIIIPRNELTLRNPKAKDTPPQVVPDADDITQPVRPDTDMPNKAPDSTKAQGSESDGTPQTGLHDEADGGHISLNSAESAVASDPSSETPASSSIGSSSAQEAPQTPLQWLDADVEVPQKKVISATTLDRRASEQEVSQNRTDVKLKKENIFGKVWKGNILVENIREHARQYIHTLNEKTRMVLSDKGLDEIEKVAKTEYDNWLGQASKGEVIRSRVGDWFARQFGGYTRVERIAVEQAGTLVSHDRLEALEQFSDRTKAVQQRFESDFLDQDEVIRKNLGENLTIIKPGEGQHAEMVHAIQNDIIHPYLEGQIDDQGLVARVDGFVTEQFKGETRLYTSSLVQLAKDYRAQFVSHALDETVIDAELANMEIRLGQAQIGEATHFEESITTKVVEKLMSRKGFWGGVGKGIAAVGGGTANEATLGTIAASAVTLGYVPRTFMTSGARMAAGTGAGFGVAATVGSIRERALLRRDFWSELRARERGGGTPAAGDKLRKFFADHAPPMTKVETLISNMTGGIYEGGKLKVNLTTEELQITLANLADAKARRIISARGGKQNVSLIEWGQAVDVGRTNLDVAIDKLERDLMDRYPTGGPEFGGASYADYLKQLTNTQTRVLLEGSQVLDGNTMAQALQPVSDKALHITLERRGFLGIGKGQKELEGLDDILKQANRDITVEAVKRGTSRAAVGTALGLGVSEGITDVLHHGFVGPLSQMVSEGRHFAAEIGIGQHVTTETIIPTHLVSVPSTSQIIDSQGVVHHIQASIPKDTNLTFDAQHGTYTLVDAKNQPLVHDIVISKDGAITGWNAQDAAAHHMAFDVSAKTSIETSAGHYVTKSTTETVAHGASVDQATTIATTPVGETVAATGGSGPTFSITEQQMGNNGPWDWIEKTLSSRHSGIEHYMPATNAETKLFNVWAKGEGYKVTDNLQYNASKVFTNVPSVFNTDGQIAVGHLMDQALSVQTQYLAAHHLTTSAADWPGWRPVYDAIKQAKGETVADLWKWGYVGLNPTQGEYTTVMNTLLHTPIEIAAPVHEYVQPVYETLSHSVITQAVSHVTTVVSNVIEPIPTVVPVIPLPRQTMMAEDLAAKVVLPHIPSSSYYGGGSVDYYRNWIKDNPSMLHSYKQIFDDAEGKKFHWVDERGETITRDVQRERRDVEAYFSEMKASDPAYYQQLESYANIPTVSSMTNLNRVSVIIPARMEEQNIYNLLQEYTQQIDASGNKVNPDLYELNIIVNRRIGEAPDNTVPEINRFIAEKKTAGESYYINYIDVEFDVAHANVGNARKTITDLTLYRSLKRPDQKQALFIESEDADLIRVDRHTVSNLITELDTKPYLDAVRGIQDRLPEQLMKNDYLFVQRRLYDFLEMLLRRPQYRPENNPTWGSQWSFFWNRVITGGWNTGYSADAYALIGGYDRTQTKGEDITIGEKMTTIRGNGQMPNLNVIGTVGTRSDSSPRRFINEIFTGQGAYSDAFENEDVNKLIKTATLDELQEVIKPVSRINDQNTDKFKALLGSIYDGLRGNLPNVDAQKAYDTVAMWIGLQKGDYVYNPDGSVSITNLSNLKNVLDSYRERHQTPLQPGERTNYGTSTPSSTSGRTT